MAQTNQLIYLCYCANQNKIFACKSFNTYELADKYMEKFTNSPNIISLKIPLCKYIPLCFRPFVLQWKISKQFFGSASQGIKIY